jgi:hypothetical protein
MAIDTLRDPVPACESGLCNHDLARGVTLAELWGGDGPFAVRPLRPLDALGRVDRFADDEPAAAVRLWAV